MKIRAENLREFVSFCDDRLDDTRTDLDYILYQILERTITYMRSGHPPYHITLQYEISHEVHIALMNLGYYVYAHVSEEGGATTIHWD